jgi:hypothetical protein
MDASGKWSEPTRVVPAPKLINATANVLDLAPRNTNITTTAAPTGGGGGSGERLLSRTAGVGATAGVVIADSSNWVLSPTATQDPVSGTLFLEIVAADGVLAGHRGYATIAFTYSDGVDQATEYAMVGDLAGVYRCDLTVTRTAAATPAGITMAVPAGALRTVVTLSVVPEGGAAGTTSFLLSGVTLWSLQSKGTATLPTTPAEQPAWVWQ